MTGRLFEMRPILPTDDEKGESYTVRLTKRNKALLIRGIHPATRVELRRRGEPTLTIAGTAVPDPSDESCGSCGHCVGHRGARTYYKCGLLQITCGPATDIRIGWPACVRWKEKVSE